MNEAVALYNWSPLVQMLLLGALIGCIPLAWLWWRHRHASASGWAQALVLLTLFLTFDLVLFGAFTRLTDSGLGCPDWPGCYGNASPLGARHEITAAQEAMPTGPVTHKKAWIEMIHRYLATSVGFLIVVLTALSWRHWLRLRRQRRQGQEVVRSLAPAADAGAGVHPAWASFTLFWVCLQGAFGAWTVTMKLFPAIVTLHLLGGIVLLMLLCVQAVRGGGLPRVAVGAGLRALMWASLLLLMLQIALGGWVSTNYAVLACSTFPDCNGAWWPEMDFAQGFEIWRELGKQRDGEYLGFAALVAIHYTHRLAAYLVIAALAWLAVRLWHLPGLQRQARWLLALLLLQFLTGLSNIVLGWPLLAAVLHTGGAAALAVLLTNVIMRSRVHHTA